MSEEVSLSVIKETQEALSKYVKKPPLTEKLLKKPPFRYLHDIVTAIIRETGFLEGLYTPDELDSNNVKEKESKIAFLDKLIVAVAKATGKNLSVKSAKIVAGLEVHKTLELLKAVGKALDQKVNTTQIVTEISKKPNEISQKPNINKSIKESNKEKKSDIVANGKTNENIRVTEDKSKSSASDKNISNIDESTNKTRKNVSSITNGRNQISKNEKSVKNLQDSKVSNRKESAAPQIKSTVKKTTVDKRSVIQNGSTPVRKSSLKESSRSVTNSTAKPLQNNTKEDKHERGVHVPLIKQTRLKNDGEQKSKKKVTLDETAANGSKINDSLIVSKEEGKRANENSDITNQRNSISSKLQTKELKLQNETSTVSKDVETPAKRRESATIQRPGSARPGSRKPSSGDGQITNANDNNYSEKSKDEIKTKVSSSMWLRSANRPSSARPGAPRIRDRGEVSTVEDDDIPNTSVNVIEEGTQDHITDDKDSFIVIESKQSPAMNEPPSTEDTDQGQLVHQILKTQKELSEGLNANSTQKSVEIEWEAGRKQEEDLTFKEVEKIRNSIQTLTSVANPIGKLFDFLQEDVDEMQRELQYWKDVNEKLQKQQTTALEYGRISLQSLQKQLIDIENNIQEECQQIANIKIAIFDNDEKIIGLATRAANTKKTIK